MNFNIDPTYDSHVHFFGTGIPAVEWDMKKDLLIPYHLTEKEFLRGFGWNDLDIFKDEIKKFSSTTKLFLSKIDGHTAFISNNLIKELNIDPIDFNSFNDLGYIISENQKDFIERFLPKRSKDDLEKMALNAQDVFLNAGFKKVRHLTCTLSQWKVLKELQEKGLLKIEIECFFSEFMEQNFEEAIEAFALALETPVKSLIKACGLKVFYDGSFGSQTAYSFIFPEIKPRLSKEQLKNRIEVAFELECDIAIHTIGEKAVEDAVEVFSKVYEDLNLKTSKTMLHLEHCPAISQKTIKAIKKIPAKLHFQPSHYLGDKKYLDKILNKEYLIYPFKELKEEKIPFFFGSDSPVVAPEIYKL